MFRPELSPECPTLASLITNLRLCHFSKFVSKKKVNISKMRQNVVRDEEIKVHLLLKKNKIKMLVTWFWSRHGAKDCVFKL